jgi:hypothetical protein
LGQLTQQKGEIGRVITELDRIASATLGRSFLELCELKELPSISPDEVSPQGVTVDDAVLSVKIEVTEPLGHKQLA